MSKMEMNVEETIFGNIPSVYFDMTFREEREAATAAVECLTEPANAKPAEEPTAHQETGALNPAGYDIFQRLKMRIAMALKKPEEPEVINIEDSDEEDGEPKWRPGQYLFKYQKELAIRKANVKKIVSAVPPMVKIRIAVPNELNKLNGVPTRLKRSPEGFFIDSEGRRFIRISSTKVVHIENASQKNLQL